MNDENEFYNKVSIEKSRETLNLMDFSKILEIISRKPCKAVGYNMTKTVGYGREKLIKNIELSNSKDIARVEIISWKTIQSGRTKLE